MPSGIYFFQRSMIRRRDKILALMGIILGGMIGGQPLHAAAEETSLTEPPSMPESSVNAIQDKEQKAREYNAQAIQLFEKGQFQEANELWEKALKLLEYPEAVEETMAEGEVRARETPAEESAGEDLSSTKEEWRKTLQESEKERQRQLQAQAEPIYQQALDYYQKRQFQQAKEYFNTVETLLPDYKSTTQYLERIDEDIGQEQKRLLDVTLNKEALARRQAQEEWRKIVEEGEQEHQKRLAEQAEPIYQTARYYYRRGKFKQAKQKFEELQGIVPGYKSTSQYLARLEQNLEKEEYKRTLKRLAEGIQAGVESKTENIYQLAAMYYQHGELKQAQQKFEEVQLVSPGYKSTKKYLARIEADIKKEKQRHWETRKRELENRLQQKRLAKTNMKSQKERSRWIDEKQRMQKIKKEIGPIYQSAVSLYKQKKYHEAKNRFQAINRLLPHYKSSVQYLAQIDEDIEREKERRFEEQQRAFAAQMRKEKLAQRKRSAERQPMSQDRGHLIVQKAVEERRKKISQEAEEKYQEALAFYRAKNFIEAKRKFTQVEAIAPGYQSTREYLSRIDEDIEKQSYDGTPPTLEAAQEIYQQALALHKAGKLVEAREKFFELDRLVPGYKTTKGYLSRLDREIGNRNRDMERQRHKEAKLANRSLQEKRKESKSTIEKEYKEAVKAYKLGQFDLAEDKLNQSESYLTAGGVEQDYLMKMQKKIKKTREQLVQRRDQRKDKTRSLSIELSPVEVLPQPDSQQSIPREQIAAGEDEQLEFARVINTQQGRIRAERAKLRQQFVKELEHLYKNAITLYKSGDHQKARELFLEIDQVWPGYENVKYYLAKLEKKAEIPPTKKRSETISEALDSLQ